MAISQHSRIYTTLILIIGFLTEINGMFNLWPFVKECKTTCNREYGCFSVETPYTNTKGILPLGPTKMGVSFLVYTRRSRRRATIIRPNFVGLDKINGNMEMKIIIHGYKDKGRQLWVKKIRNALLRKGNVTVVVLDWRRGASHMNYLRSAANSRMVGKMLGKFLHKLQEERGLNASKVHIIGHSLGAHIAGYAGQEVRHIGRITGLDPAGPAFQDTDPEVRLDPTDALFVDVIHTDGEPLLNYDLHPGFGTLQKWGSVDFYPNKGYEQPGCPITLNQQVNRIIHGDIDLVTNFGCSHFRAVKFFTESIMNKCRFMAYPCHKGFEVGPECNTCKDGCARMGYYSDIGNPRGVFVLNTNANEPFCIRPNNNSIE